MSDPADIITSNTMSIQFPEHVIAMHRRPDELRAEIKNALGYQFDWGFIVESASEEGISWDFYLVTLYELCPNVGFWTDWFHAILDEDAYPTTIGGLREFDEGDGSMSCFGISAKSQKVLEVRNQLAAVFLPGVLPSLLKVARLVGRAWQTRDIVFYHYSYGALFASENTGPDRVELANMRRFMAERYGADLCF